MCYDIKLPIFIPCLHVYLVKKTFDTSMMENSIHDEIVWIIIVENGVENIVCKVSVICIGPSVLTKSRGHRVEFTRDALILNRGPEFLHC